MSEIADAIVEGRRPPIPEGIPSLFKQLIEQCWSQDPIMRPSFSTILDILTDMQQ